MGGGDPSFNSPLLVPVPNSELGSGSDGEGSERGICSFCCWNDSEILAEVKQQLWLAGPLIAVNLLQYCLQVISIMFVGHLGELALSGASMATSFANVTGFSLLALLNWKVRWAQKKPNLNFENHNYKHQAISHFLGVNFIFLLTVRLYQGLPPLSMPDYSNFSLAINAQLGMGSALDTLCGQAYGAKQYHILGIHMQRAIFVLLLVSIPLAFVWAYTSQILMVLGQNPDISMEAGLYARWLIPSLFAYGFLQCQVRFLQTQRIVFPMMISSGITALLHIFVCWVLVYNSSLGSKGAALATAISYWINVFLLVVYVQFSQACKKTWTGLSKEALHDVLSFLRLAVPSAFMICLEYWSFEMVVLLSGLLPNPKLETSVLSISLNTMWMVYMIPTGLSSVVSIRVSNELGAGHPQAARLSVHVVVIIAIIEGLIVALTTILVARVWGYLYSNEEEVVKYVAMMMPILAISDFMDGIQCTLSGAARGCGWQKICSYINLGAYYAVGIPSAILFAFVLHAGGKGLWMGIICALFVQLLVLVIMILRTDWDNEARKAMDRVYNSGIPVEAIS